MPSASWGAIDGDEAVFTWTYNPNAVDADAVEAAAATAGRERTRLADARGDSPGTAGTSLDAVNQMLAELTRNRRADTS